MAKTNICRRPKCGHRWEQKTDKIPVVCPRCKSYKWNEQPKRTKR